MYKSYNANERRQTTIEKKEGGDFMGYVKMPGMLSPEVVKALAGNAYIAKGEPNPKDEMAAAWKEYIKKEKKCDEKEDKKCEPPVWWHDENDCCCPKKIKFIFVLNNAVVINTNVVCEEDDCPA